MCIIIYKPAGISMPSGEIIDNCWNGNSDGAGIMYARSGNLIINKGHMGLLSLKKQLHTVRIDDVAVVHFRFATHGAKSPGMTHPFPVTNDMQQITGLNISAISAIAHNGIMPIQVIGDLSDSATWAMAMANNDPLCQQVSIGQKIIQLNNDGSAIFHGSSIDSWIFRDGIYYSNSGFEHNRAYAYNDYQDFAECMDCQSYINTGIYCYDICPVCGGKLSVDISVDFYNASYGEEVIKW